MSYFVPCTPAGVSSWSQITALDGVSFVLTFRWSQRDGRWLLDIADAEGVAVRVGCPLNTGVPLLRGCVSTRRPAGELIVVDSTGANDADPSFADLGDPGARFALMYVTAVEMAA